jgi:hypothetical protein
MAHLLQQGAGDDFWLSKEDPREDAPHEENDIQSQKTRRSAHEAVLVRTKTRSALPAQSRVRGRIRQEKKHLVHAAPTRKQPFLATPTQSCMLVVAFLPRSAWILQRAREGRQPSPTTLVDRRSSLHRLRPSTPINGIAVPLLGRVCGNPFPKLITGRRTSAL